MMASSFAKALGIKQSKTGAAIGGAIGSFVPIPGGAAIGGLIGGPLGGLFKKTKQGGATISATDGVLGTSLFGNTGAAKNATSAAGRSVTDQRKSVPRALGATFAGWGSATLAPRPGTRRGTTGHT